MEPKQIVRYLFRGIESRKEILKIAYGREEAKRKKIEPWIDTEMLAKLLELKEKNERKGGEKMNGDGLNFDQSDVDNDEEFEKMRKDLVRARYEFFVEGKCNHKCYGSSEFEK